MKLFIPLLPYQIKKLEKEEPLEYKTMKTIETLLKGFPMTMNGKVYQYIQGEEGSDLCQVFIDEDNGELQFTRTHAKIDDWIFLAESMTDEEYTQQSFMVVNWEMKNKSEDGIIL